MARGALEIAQELQRDMKILVGSINQALPHLHQILVTAGGIEKIAGELENAIERAKEKREKNQS